MKTKMKDDLEDIPMSYLVCRSRNHGDRVRCGACGHSIVRLLKVCGSNHQIHHRLRRFEA
jgi:hypothetical protein